jgi:hypothetical protein
VRTSNHLSHRAATRTVESPQVGLGTGEVGMAPAGHAWGSHCWSFEVVGDGAAIEAEAGEVVAVVEGGVGEDEALGAPVVGAAGAFTVNWVPVTTVTWAPSVTWLGS